MKQGAVCCCSLVRPLSQVYRGMLFQASGLQPAADMPAWECMRGARTWSLCCRSATDSVAEADMRCRCCTAMRGLAGAAAASRLENRALKCMCFSMLRALSLRFLLRRLGGDPWGSCRPSGRGRAARGLPSWDLQAMSGWSPCMVLNGQRAMLQLALWLPGKGEHLQRLDLPGPAGHCTL